MTIQITYGTPTETFSTVYRKVYAGKNLAEYVESFYAQQQVYQWGVMVQLKGNGVLKMHQFGSNNA